MEAETIIRHEGHLGRITLNRPTALNALTLGMVRSIAAALDEWAIDPAIRTIVIDGAGHKAFCAGGDVTALYHAATLKDYAFPAQFWAEEYALNYRIGRFGKPIVALVHGFCMGGGVGLACHARHRIVGESARIAMPECTIGLVPDVGGTALLARAPAGIGPWMALTGARLEPGPAIAAGFADHYVPEARWDDLRTALAGGEDIAGLLARLATQPLAAKLSLPEGAQRAAFTAASVPAIRDMLNAVVSEGALSYIEVMDRASPLAMATALQMQQRLGPDAELEAALALEYRAVQRALKTGDFIEGVRARIIDRDNAPRWQHASIGQVSRVEVAAQLAEIEGHELMLQANLSEEGVTQ